jgi:NADH dehydrogenase/NADH:ubiquinone oxidoreductase 75 kD subunit (chain G)
MVAKALFVPLAAKRGSEGAAPTVTVYFNDKPLKVPANTSLAAGLLAAGVTRFRNAPVSGTGRAPYCMMGVCYECLVEVDDVPSQQACLTRPQEGMRVRSMDDLPGLAFYDAEGRELPTPTKLFGEGK